MLWRRAMREDGGWALIDALASAVLVVLAFTASQSLLESSQSSATRDATKTQAMLMAERQINWMRSVGTKDPNALLALNGEKREVTYRGTTFTATYEARPRMSSQGGSVEPCSVDRASASESESIASTLPMVFMRVVVTGRSPSKPDERQLAALDSNFAADAVADPNSNGMLRVYVLDLQGAVSPGVTSVTLKQGLTGAILNPAAASPQNGCYLFTDLEAGPYTIQVASPTLKDIYLVSTGGVIRSDYTMPPGVLKSTTVTLATPVNVSPVFRARTDAGTASTSINAASNGNALVKLPARVPYWQAQHADLYNPPNNSYFYSAPNGMYLPPADPAMDGKLFPTTSQYGAYPGPCRVNDPGPDLQTRVPDSMNNVSWAPSATLTPSPEMWLSLVRPTGTISALSTVRPNPFWNPWNLTYYWNQTYLDGQVQVMLIGSNKAGRTPTTTPTGCRPGVQINQWYRLPGFSAKGAALADAASALPTGRYRVCMRTKFSYTQQAYRSVFPSGWLNRPSDRIGFGYSYQADLTVGYRDPPWTSATNFTPPNIVTLMTNGNSSRCGDATLWV